MKSIFCDIGSLVSSPCCKILESISDSVFTIDSEKRITSFNHSAEIITGFNRQEAVGQYCFDIFRADLCEKDCALDQTFSLEKSQINLPARIISKNGDAKPIRLSTAILKDETGDIIGAVETFRDVSELEALRRRADHCFMPEDIIGRHPRITKILSFLPDIAESDSTVIIEGPTDRFRQRTHRQGHPSTQPPKKGAVCRPELRSPAVKPAGIGTFRILQRRVHRCHDEQAGTVSGGRRRHLVFG